MKDCSRRTLQSAAKRYGYRIVIWERKSSPVAEYIDHQLETDMRSFSISLSSSCMKSDFARETFSVHVELHLLRHAIDNDSAPVERSLRRYINDQVQST